MISTRYERIQIQLRYSTAGGNAPAMDSERTPKLRLNMDIYFGPKARRSGIELDLHPAEKSWFPWFRFYGPDKALFDKSWTMPDIEMVKQ